MRRLWALALAATATVGGCVTNNPTPPCPAMINITAPCPAGGNVQCAVIGTGTTWLPMPVGEPNTRALPKVHLMGGKSPFVGADALTQ